MMDTEVCATSYKLCSFELSPVICEDPPRYAEPIYDALQKLDSCFLRDVYHLHDLYPFGEGVKSDE
jgi:hypothetical protein